MRSGKDTSVNIRLTFAARRTTVGHTTPVLLGCVADDLTGATDLADALVRSGLPTTLWIGPPDDDRGDGAGAEPGELRPRPRPTAGDPTPRPRPQPG